MTAEIFEYVRRCELCQRAKPAQDKSVGLHSDKSSTQPMGKLFIDFVGPLVRCKRGNIPILVILDAFPSLYPSAQCARYRRKRCQMV